ncbi:MAG: cell division protein FtsZ [Spirochaetes bacterium]|nr:cell division protein FtsZ [Spirochaetota bacterium]
MQEKEESFRKAIANESLGDFGTPKILVVGCGGGGNNTINRLYNIGVSGAETIAINTDKIHLDNIEADKKILIGKSLTRGLGASGFPEVGKRAAELAKGTLTEVLKDADLVFVTAGMGGGTGTGVAPVVAEIAKEQGAIVIGMVTSPFRVERSRLVKAEEGLDELRNVADTVIVLDNNRLLDYCPNVPIDQAFSVMDQLISETIKGISETITQPSLINIDYADVKAIMSSGGLAVMLVGEAKGQDMLNDVVRNTLNHPLLDVDINGATGCLLQITSGPNMSLQEAEKIASSLSYELGSMTSIMWGARLRLDYEDKIRCIAIMTGIKYAQIMGQNSESATIVKMPTAIKNNAGANTISW